MDIAELEKAYKELEIAYVKCAMAYFEELENTKAAKKDAKFWNGIAIKNNSASVVKEVLENE